MPSLPDAVASQFQTLKASAGAWLDLPDSERAAVARACKAQLATLPLEWMPEDLLVLGLDPAQGDFYNTGAFDPFLFVSCIGRWLDGIADRFEGKLEFHPDEQGRYQLGEVDVNGTPGCELEAWTDSSLPAEAEPAGGACVVLGAGNHNFLTFCDVLDRAFLHKEAVFLKHHPLRAHMARPFRHVLQPLAALGAYADCTDVELEGAHEALLKGAAHVHFTGSGATHDRVAKVLRPGQGLSAELGNVTPWIVCPGEWTDAAVKHHARMLALSFKASCSMLCLAPKVLVLPSEQAWPQRAAFLEQLRDHIKQLPQLPSYYPGAHARMAAFEAACDGQRIESPPAQQYPKVEAVHESQDLSPLPSFLVDAGELGGKQQNTYAFQNEAFAPVLAVATVSCEAADYPLAAARAVNAELFGSLTANVIYPGPRDEALDAMVGELRYGAVSVNMWSALQYSNPLGVWGGAPGTYSKSKPCSGRGFVGNVAGLEKVSKSVMFAPFVHAKALKEPMPKPLATFLFALVTKQWSYLLPSMPFCR